MLSRKIKPLSTRHSRSHLVGARPKSPPKHFVFFPLLILLLLMWWIYRGLFQFPVWFDETIGKAVFFGLPVWLYISLSGAKSIGETYAPRKIYKGLLVGIAVGGLFGFVGSLTTLVGQGVVVKAAPLFLSNAFWGQFFLALMTGFWETLFFYCWIMTVILEKFPKWSFMHQLLITVGIFLLFHLPNTILRFHSPQIIIGQIFLLALFALGQALFFYRWRNLYALALSQAIWGMVLLVNTR